MEQYIDGVEVHAVDEFVVNHYFNDEVMVGVYSMTVAEAEKYIELLQEAIEVAKKSEYYVE